MVPPGQALADWQIAVKKLRELDSLPSNAPMYDFDANGYPIVHVREVFCRMPGVNGKIHCNHKRLRRKYLLNHLEKAHGAPRAYREARDNSMNQAGKDFYVEVMKDYLVTRKLKKFHQLPIKKSLGNAPPPLVRKRGLSETLSATAVKSEPAKEKNNEGEKGTKKVEDNANKKQKPSGGRQEEPGSNINDIKKIVQQKEAVKPLDSAKKVANLDKKLTTKQNGLPVLKGRPQTVTGKDLTAAAGQKDKTSTTIATPTEDRKSEVSTLPSSSKAVEVIDLIEEPAVEDSQIDGGKGKAVVKSSTSAEGDEEDVLMALEEAELKLERIALKRRLAVLKKRKVG